MCKDSLPTGSSSSRPEAAACGRAGCQVGTCRLPGLLLPLPELPADMKTLPLRLRIEDYRPAKNNLEIVYVGPIRLLELDRQ